METAKEIADKLISSDMLATMSIAMGINPTYDKQMLLDIERYISTQFNPNHKPLPTTCVMFGILLGETIIRNVEGFKWDDSNVVKYMFDDLKLIGETTKSEGSIIINPVVRIDKFFNDKEDSIVALFLLADLMSNYDIHSTEFKNKFLNDEGWITMSDGYTFRFREFKT